MRMRGWLIFAMVALISAAALWLCLANGIAEDEVQIIAPSDKDTCLGCHAENIDQKHFEASAHGQLSCQVCHAGIDQFPHPEKALSHKPACADCHRAENAKFAKSSHAHTKKQLNCLTCHGENAHTIAHISSIPRQKQLSNCSTCHQKIAATLATSAHGKRLDCLTCHGGDAHGITAAKKSAFVDSACRNCHIDLAKSMAKSAHGNGVSCQNCHGNSAHAVATVSSASLSDKGKCDNCHQDVQHTVANSTHRKDGINCASCHGQDIHSMRKPVATDGSTCVTCHTDVALALTHTAHGPSAKKDGQSLHCQTCHGEKAHSVTIPADTSNKAELCRSCHRDTARELSVSAHGIAMRKTDKAPDCTACHGGAVHKVQPIGKHSVNSADSLCATCHKNIAGQLTTSVHGKIPSAVDSGPTCLACHGDSAHKLLPLREMNREQQERACKSCHKSLSQSLRNSVHDRPDKVAGDHPTCLYCHGGNPHQIVPPKHKTPQERAYMCGKCHSDAARMGRYGLTTEALTSYEQTFHGKALLRFKRDNSANCTDCHGLHGVLAPDNPDAPTNPRHVVQTCRKCHKDANLNFAMSGANHLRSRIQSSAVLRLEDMLFRLLIFGSMSFLFGMVALNLRIAVFRRDSNPESGKPAAFFIALSFFALVFGIVFAYLRVPHVWIAFVIAATCMVIAFILYWIKRQFTPHHQVKKWYLRMSPVQRIQHFLLAGSFTVLVLTGFPLRFADAGWSHVAVQFFGGFEFMRIIHRVAGVLMVVNWVAHLGYLLVRWRRYAFSFKSWSMFPAWKDVTDCWETILYGIGVRRTPPECRRFQFREKFDYFADMWGTIVMGVSGFIMWFPTTIGNRLPDLAFGASYIAHSYEGLLAMMAILVWHFYNVHFNPDIFPMNPAWLTGYISDEEMARDHPLEKMEVDRQSSKDGPKIPTLH